jgi:spore maturation protein CgeB
MYGHRGKWIAALCSSGIKVACFGHGTEHGVVDAAKIPEIYRSSRISLNFSGSGQNPGGAGRLAKRQIKARAFEVPGAGGFLLTEAAPGLEQYFSVGSEISAFVSPSDLIAKVQYFLEHPKERDSIAQAGYARTVAEHTYEQRFAQILAVLRSQGAERGTKVWTLSTEALDAAVNRYRAKRLIAWLRSVLVAPMVLVFGDERGPRAARRLVYELSWRLSGAATYAARGLPGRLFYNES